MKQEEKQSCTKCTKYSKNKSIAMIWLGKIDTEIYNIEEGEYHVKSIFLHIN